MKPRLYSLALALICAAVSTPLAAQDSPGTDLRDQSSSRETARFLLTPIGARTVGLAGAVSASRADLEGVLWNPASAASVERPSAYFLAANDFGTASQVLCFFGHWGDVMSGLTLYQFDIGSIDALDESYHELG